ncbi:MAG: carbonic anhydrase family protein [Flavobacteriales bacterium]
MRTHTQATQNELTPELALEILQQGNLRFMQNMQAHRDLLEQVNATSDGQFPFAAILSCIDSRTSAELIFDQGLGDIFSIRVAGNILNDDILGSMEYACKLSGSKLIVVLGHTRCGAITGACNNVELGHVTAMLKKVAPAIAKETETTEDRSGANENYVRNVTKINVDLTVRQVRKQSPILAEMERAGEIKIVGGLYDVESGHVSFTLDEK